MRRAMNASKIHILPLYLCTLPTKQYRILSLAAAVLDCSLQHTRVRRSGTSHYEVCNFLAISQYFITIFEE